MNVCSEEKIQLPATASTWKLKTKWPPKFVMENHFIILMGPDQEQLMGLRFKGYGPLRCQVIGRLEIELKRRSWLYGLLSGLVWTCNMLRIISVGSVKTRYPNRLVPVWFPIYSVSFNYLIHTLNSSKVRPNKLRPVTLHN